MCAIAFLVLSVCVRKSCGAVSLLRCCSCVGATRQLSLWEDCISHLRVFLWRKVVLDALVDCKKVLSLLLSQQTGARFGILLVRGPCSSGGTHDNDVPQALAVPHQLLALTSLRCDAVCIAVSWQRSQSLREREVSLLNRSLSDARLKSLCRLP